MSVYRDKGGAKRWIADVTDEQLPGGRLKRRFRTKGDAVAWERRMRTELADGSWAEAQRQRATRVTLAEWWPRYLEAARTGGTPSGRCCGEKTLYVRESRWRLHIEPELGSVYLDDITTRHIEVLKVKLAAKGLHESSRNRCLALLRAMLSVAEHWELIDRAPKVRLVSVPDQGHVQFLTEADLAELLELVAAPQWRVMVLLAARTGMRKGELRALRWTDVDLDHAHVDVQRAMSQGRLKGTKGNRSRRVPLPADAAEALRAHPRRLGSPWVFTGADGQPLTEHACSSAARRWKAAFGADRFRGWHTLRHTWASHLVAAGVDLVTVQELGGWTSLSLVQRYAHLLPDARSTALAKLEAQILRGRIAAAGKKGRGDT